MLERSPLQRVSPQPFVMRHSVDDAALLAGIRAGEEASFELLFRSYYGRLHLYAEGYVRSPEVAEDLTVEVFARIWERRADWEVHGSIRAYLYAAVRNEALMHVRRRRMLARMHSDPAFDLRPPGMGAPGPAPDASLEAEELTLAVEAAIARLPERSREAFVLHRKHGLSYAEVAAAMGISPRTVEVHVSRALKALRVNLKGFFTLLLQVVL